MATVEFGCEHCQKRMAVGSELRGSIVRCPHCQQIVLVPTADTAATFDQLATEDLAAPGGGQSALAHQPVTPVSQPASPAAAGGDATLDTGRELVKSVGRQLRGSEVEAVRRNQWVLAILVPYAIFMTVAAITYFTKFQNAIMEHPLELIPDLIGEYQRQQTKGASQTLKLPDPAQPLPPRLVTALGRPLIVGAIEVTPLKIEYGPWMAFAKEKNHDEPEKRPVRDTLVLHVQLRNVSQDLTFYPTDPYFDRRPKHANDRPFTLVEVGPHKFFGGLIEYDTAGGRYERSWVEGQENERTPLRPGASRLTVFVTRPSDGVFNEVKKSGAQAIWRIHVRRGLVTFHDRELPVSAVVGVAFSAADVHTAG